MGLSYLTWSNTSISEDRHSMAVSVEQNSLDYEYRVWDLIKWGIQLMFSDMTGHHIFSCKQQMTITDNCTTAWNMYFI